MTNTEIYDENEKLLTVAELPFVPRSGEYISIEKDDFFKYYYVDERWIKIDQKNVVTVCISAVLKD